jgi:hypothetical protein
MPKTQMAANFGISQQPPFSHNAICQVLMLNQEKTLRQIGYAQNRLANQIQEDGAHARSAPFYARTKSAQETTAHCCLTNKIIPIKKKETIILMPNYQRSSRLQVFFQSATRISPTTMSKPELYKCIASSPHHRSPRSLTHRLKWVKHGRFTKFRQVQQRTRQIKGYKCRKMESTYKYR